MIRPINRCLNAQLLDLCKKAIKLDEIKSKVKATLEVPLSDNCEVAAFNRGCLVLSVANAAWATELRYQLPELRDKLRQAGLYQLSSIKIALANFEAQPLPRKKPAITTLSVKARANIRSAGELCNYKPLKDALNHLANDEHEIE